MKKISLIIAVLAFILLPFSTAIEAAPLFSLYDPGTQFPVNYESFGTFSGIGTSGYSYTITNSVGLSAAVGEGIYPNTTSVYQDPEYQRYLAEGRLNGSQWDFVNSPDPQADFYKWATASEEPGVKMFYMAQALTNAGLINHAIKAYYCIIVNFPYTPSWDPGGFYWYVGPAAVNMINYLCREYPEVGLRLMNARVVIENGEDLDLINDIVTTTPGNYIPYTLQDRIAGIVDLNQLSVVQTRGTGKVQAVKYSNGHWQLKVNGKPFVIRGVTYGPTKVGLSSSETSIWQFADDNANGLIDAPYESWVDENRNNLQDINEPAIGDFQLLKDMGCNAIRMYHGAGADNKTYVPGDYNKTLLRDMHNKYGIKVIVSDFLGAYCVGSGATWSAGTDYTDPQQRENMKAVVRAMVLDHKDEPYVLFWLLGNENNLEVTNTNAKTHPREWAEFLNEVADMIHQLDPDHPVAVGNFMLRHLEYYAQYAPALDIVGSNSYPGRYGFGISLYTTAQEKFDRPIFFTEYGADAYHYNVGVNEREQAEYHEGCWKDVVYNSAGEPGKGVVLGGLIFEWLDEWWKAPGDSNFNHDTQPQFWMGSAPDGWSHEEWYGICGQGNGNNSPFLREVRQAYYSYKYMWAPPVTRDPVNGNIILSWSTFPGLTYDVYYSNDSVNWVLAQSGLPASSISQAAWTDDGTYTGVHPNNLRIRYYRVIINGTVPARVVLEANSGGSGSGTVLIQGRTNRSDTITFELRNPGTTTVIKTYTITTAADGTYSLTDMPRGTYDLTAKSPNTLRAKAANIVVDTAKNTAIATISLRGGDANNDNSVGTADMIILKNAWLSGIGQPRWDPRADFNADKSIGTSDMLIMQSNWLKSGVQQATTQQITVKKQKSHLDK